MIITDSSQNKETLEGDNTRESYLEHNSKFKVKRNKSTSRLIDIDSHHHQIETTHHLVQTIHFKYYLNIPHI